MTTHVLSRKRAWALALVATFTMSISYVDRQTLAVLAPTVTKALSISDTEYGWLGSAFAVAYLIGAPLAGRVLDRAGVRRGLLVAVLVWTSISALHSLVMGFVSLFLLRVLLGFAESPSFPGAAQTVHRALPPADRARGMGVLFTGSSIGAMIAAPLASRLAGQFGWRTAMLVTSIFGLIWLPLWIGLTGTNEARAVLDVKPQPSAAPPPPMLSLLAHPAVRRAIILVIATAPIIFFALVWMSKLLVRRYEITQTEVGNYLWAPPILYDLGSIAFGDLAARRARRLQNDGSSARGLVLVAAVLALAIAFVPFAPTAFWSAVVVSVALLGGGGLYAMLTADMLSRVPTSAVSAAGGLTAAAQSIAQMAAGPLIGASVQATHSFNVALWALAAWQIPGTVVWIFSTPPPLTAETSTS